MSTANQKKRPAEQSPATVPAKRASTKKDAEIEVIEVEDDMDFHLDVDLHSKFKVFPDLLRDTLQKSYKTTIRSQMDALMTNTIPRYKYTYTVVSELSVRPSDKGPNRTILKTNISSLSLCNTALLNIFLKRGKDLVPKSRFVRLVTRQGLTNPGFTQLHSVRHGETGWGFDVNGCLSLHVPFIEHNQKHEYNIFVERVELKVEQEEEL
ncbi:hypothetical protein CC86DRAFT_462423 [Ophiobolus disseminans]|uniref:Uncharacterized protein n=1 Tax=Ophiobolus disseminans TaxID=1469910 RepID=A0A6A7AFM7_9PLEO|nr:hypothetical protein CC86DRAFT_462423 [Ophiobolus disseminans]